MGRVWEELRGGIRGKVVGKNKGKVVGKGVGGIVGEGVRTRGVMWWEGKVEPNIREYNFGEQFVNWHEAPLGSEPAGKSMRWKSLSKLPQVAAMLVESFTFVLLGNHFLNSVRSKLNVLYNLP